MELAKRNPHGGALVRDASMQTPHRWLIDRNRGHARSYSFAVLITPEFDPRFTPLSPRSILLFTPPLRT
jgi:hypothetical protein